MIGSFFSSLAYTYGRTRSTVPISRSMAMTSSLAPPCSGPFRAPIAEATTVYGSARVEAVTSPQNVEAFIVCSAWRIRHTSRMSATSRSGTRSVSMYRKFSLKRSSSRRAGKWLKRRRNAVSRNVLFEASSSMRMPRYSRTPPWPSTSLIRERAAGTPAKPGMKSCGIEKSIPWTPLHPRAREDLELLASGAAHGFLLLLHLLLRQREGSPARLAGADLEHRLAVFKAGRQEQVGRVVPQHDAVRELHDRQPDVELLPGGRLSLPGQRMVRADIDRLPVLAVAEVPEVTGFGGGHRKIAGLLKRPLFGTRHGAIYTIRFRRGSSLAWIIREHFYCNCGYAAATGGLAAQLVSVPQKSTPSALAAPSACFAWRLRSFATNRHG